MKEENIFINALKNYIGEKKDSISYGTLTNFIFEDMILCNNIVKYNGNGSNWDLELGEEYDEETGYIDIYQYYIVDVNIWRLEKYKEYLQETNKPSDLILWYDNELDIYILGVSHCGTSWSYVPTNIEINKQEEE